MSKTPDFTKIDLQFNSTGKETVFQKSWQTNEQIPIKSFYTTKDLENAEHLDYTAGILSLIHI